MSKKELKVFVIRNNFSSEKDSQISDIRNKMREKGEIGILVDQDYEWKDWNANKNFEDEIRIKHKKSQFISRWLKMEQIILKEDVLVVASYLNYPSKVLIGKIKKGTKRNNYANKKGLFYFQMEDHKSISTSEYPALLSLLPQQTTVSPYYKKKGLINSIYFGREIKLEVSNMSDRAVEAMCLEWLRHLAPESNRLKHLLTKIGGNMKTIDAYGLNTKNEEVFIQITTSKKREIVEKKVKSLLSFNNSIMFSDLKDIDELNKTVKHYNVNSVLEEFLKNDNKIMIEKLVRL
jgi:transcriptional regulator with PAS, ATPase and Fis domain